jgi:hypothetical protein
MVFLRGALGEDGIFVSGMNGETPRQIVCATGGYETPFGLLVPLGFELPDRQR